MLVDKTKAATENQDAHEFSLLGLIFGETIKIYYIDNIPSKHYINL
jgi:hypothetical protein